MKKRLSQVGELGLIEMIRRSVPKLPSDVVGIGDDTAVLPWDERHDLLLTVDMIADGVDFKLNSTPAESIGRKALAVNLSDIAAMGGWPFTAVVSLGLPKDLPVTFVKKFYSGMGKLAKEWKVSVVGGDISRASEFSASVTVLGKVEKGKRVLRRGAKAGDWIFVTGKLGGSILGKHLSFIPRLSEARLLVEKFSPTAMIDISDGLIQDLRHLLEESGKGAVIDLARVPVSDAARRLSKRDRVPAIQHALCDGEDFELLFSVGKKDGEKLLKLRGGLKGTPVHRIGQMTRNKGLYFHQEAGNQKGQILSWKGYEHF